MGAHQNAVQRAVIFVFTMVSALLNGALDALIGMTVHKKASFDLDSKIVCCGTGKVYRQSFPMLHFVRLCAILLEKTGYGKCGFAYHPFHRGGSCPSLDLPKLSVPLCAKKINFRT